MKHSDKINPAHIEDILALTPMQAGMLSHHLRDSSGVWYVSQTVLDIAGIFDVGPAEEAWNVVIRKHGMLRCVFRWKEVERPVQVVLKKRELRVSYFNLEDLEESEKQERLYELLRRERDGCTDLSRAPFRVLVCKMEAELHKMAVSNHHLLYDGWSNGILLTEFLDAYRQAVSGPIPAPAVEPPPRFKEYLLWLERRDKKAQEEFWREFMKDYSPCYFPLKPLSGIQRQKTPANVQAVLPVEIHNQLKRGLHELHVSLSEFLYGVWGLVSRRYCGQDDVAFGTTVSGRPPNIAGIGKAVGMFINTVPLRIRATGAETVGDYLKGIRASTQRRAGAEHAALTDISRWSRLESGDPLFDTIMVVENYPIAMESFERELPHGASISLGAVVEESHYDLAIRVLPSEKDIRVDFKFFRETMDEELVSALAEHFANLAAAMMRNPSACVEDLDMLSPAERRRILHEFNGTAADYPLEKTVIDLLAERVGKNPSAIACVGGDSFAPVHVSFSCLDEMSNSVAANVAARTQRKGSIIAITGDQSLEFLAGIVGILKSGNVFLPLDPQLPEARIQYQMADSGASVLLGTGDDTATADGAAATLSELAPSSSSPAYVIYTSGSTGRPKGVLVRHKAVTNLVFWHINSFNVTVADRGAKYAAVGFDASVWEIFPYLSAGAALYIVPPTMRADLVGLNRFLHRFSVTIAFLPTDVCRQFMELDNRSLRLLLTGGSQLKHYSKQSYHLYNNYGPTESTVVCASYPVNRWEPNIPIGKPVDNCELYVFDHHGVDIQPVGAPGELCVAGVGLADGYVGDPCLTAEKFVRHPRLGGRRIYRTGDLARWRLDGNLEFLGRVDTQIKIRGFRIETGEIEATLLRHPQVEAAAVIPLGQLEEERRDLCAYVIPVDKDTLDAGELRDFLGRELPQYMVPPFYVVLDTFPLTKNGKVDKRALAKLRPEVTESGNVAPRDKMEMRLVSITAGVLGLDDGKVGIYTNLFELGLHSLKATILAAKIRRAFDIEFPLVVLYKHPTVAGMTAFIKQSLRQQIEEIPPVEKKDCYPLSSAQQRLFFLSRFEDIGISYNMPSVVDFEGRLDVPRLTEVFRQLGHRHESLRTAFVMIGDQPVQRVLARAEVHIEQFQYEDDVDIKSEEDAVRRVMDSFIQPFRLEEPPLLRVGVMEPAPDRFKILFDMHHIISDGTSMANLVRDFDAFYHRLPLPPLHIQYKDYAVWQQDREMNGRLGNQEEYWRELLQGNIPRLPLAADRPRPAVFTFEGGRYTFAMSRGKLRDFLDLGARHGVTLFMNLLAAFNVLLHRLTGQEDIIVGTSVAGRNVPEIQKTVGMFVNALAMRCAPIAGLSVDSFLEDVGNRSRQAFENQDVQFEKLVEQLDPHRDASRNPIFDVCLVVQNFGVIKSEIEGMTFDQKGYKSGTTKFDLTVFVYENDDELIFDLEYYTPIFYPETVARLGDYLKNVMLAMAKDPAQALGDIDVMGPEERRRLIEAFNQTAAPFPQDRMIHELFDRAVQKHPRRMAVVEGNAGVSYNFLHRQANRLANYLLDSDGFRAEELVVVLFDPSIDLAVAILGVLKAGGAFLPLDPDAPLSRLKQVMDDSAARIIVSQKRHIDTLNRLQWECRHCRVIVCLDSDNILLEEEQAKNALMDEALWDYVAESAADEISGGGWNSSFTGKPFSPEEMAEYSRNVSAKLQPVLSPSARVLEIGCASGLTMYNIAPQVDFYMGTDLSAGMIRLNRERIHREGHNNIALQALPAHHIDRLEESGFHLVVVNSVIQSFHGLNYLRAVIARAVALMAGEGYLFIGDVMDLEQKGDLIRDLSEFKRKCHDEDLVTKLDWENELFVSRAFFHDLAVDVPQITGIEITDKIFTIENELTKYRFDVLIKVDKRRHAAPVKRKKLKLQHDRGALAAYCEESPILPADPNRPAYVIYTSGTSGIPKGVMIEHLSLVNYIAWSQRRYLDDGGGVKVFPLYTALAFDMTVTSLFLPLTTGNAISVYWQGAFGKEESIFRIFADGLADIIKTTPSHLKLLRAGFYTNKFHKKPLAVIVGGEQLDWELASWLEGTYPGDIKIYNEYGPTEATVGCTHYLFDKESDSQVAVSIGSPVDNAHIYICDDRLRPVPFNVAGQIFIGGAGLSRGYINRPDMTAERFIDNPFVPGEKLYATGDLARRRGDGTIDFIGRLDSQIKVRGFRIEVEDIERHLSLYPGVSEAKVIPFGGDDGDVELRAYVTGLHEGVDPLDIRRFLAAKLPAYMIPGKIMFLQSFPLTSSGKLDIRSLSQTGLKGSGDYTAPANRLERRLVELWSDILKIPADSIGIDTNFFDIGGHSLKVANCMTAISREFHVDISMGEFFTSPYIGTLARRIREERPRRYIEIPPAEKKDYYPLTSSQKRLFLLQMMDPASTLYNETACYEIKGDLNSARLERAVGELTRRHQMLRTSFHVIDGIPVQRIHPEAHVAIDHYKAGGTAVTCREFTRPFVRPFDLERAPLFRMGLARLEDRHYWLLADFHHIVCDGISLAIVIRECSRLYQGQDDCGELSPQYKDYAQWRQGPEFLDSVETQEEFWLHEFDGEIPRLNLPLDFPRPRNKSRAGDAVKFSLGEESSRLLTELAATEQTTLFMTLLAVYAMLLSKLTSQTDFVVGTPVAGRPKTELEPLIGMFVRTLALRVNFSNHDSFQRLLRQVKEISVRGLENQDYPFEELVNRLGVETELNRNPLFDTMFAVQNIERAELEIPGLDIAPLDCGFHPPKFDLTWHAWQERGDIRFLVEYDAALFRKETVLRFCDYYKNILKSVVERPGVQPPDIEIITEREKRTILEEFNVPPINVPPRGEAIHSYFEELASRYPHRIAVQDPGSSVQLTYGCLNILAGRTAAFLVKREVREDSIVAVMMDRNVELLIALMGILKAGGAYLPIMPDYPMERNRFMLVDSGANLLLTTSQYMEIGDWPAEAVDISDLPEGENHEGGIPATGLAYCIYTSGSTGRPKGALIEHRSAVNLLLAMQRYYPMEENDAWLFKTTHGFDVSVVELFGWFFGGGRVVALEPGGEADPGATLDYVERFAVTHLNFTPALFNILVNNYRDRITRQCSRLKYIFAAGEALAAGPAAAFKAMRLNARLENLYGPTEATVYASRYSLEEWNCGQIPIGKPLSNVSLYIFNRFGHLQPPGLAGELYIGGTGLFRGYLNRPELTAERLTPHPFKEGERLYKTGDMARWRADGNIEFLGRMDYQVKVRGFRIELGEIESRLLCHPGVDKALVMARGVKFQELQLCAYVVPGTETKLTYSELKEFLSSSLPDYMIPPYVVFLDNFPLTANGKVDRNALPEPDETIDGPFIAPRNEVERALASIWADALSFEIKYIGIDNNFFELGGHSLNGLKVLGGIQKEFQIDLPMSALSKANTIRSLSKLLERQTPQAAAGLTAVEKREYHPITSSQKRFYLLQRMDKTGISYNMSSSWSIEGELDEAELQQALKKMLDRHESLRTGFVMDGEEPMQRIFPAGALEVVIERIECPPLEVNKTIANFIRPFDLAAPPLLRAGLSLLPDKRRLLMLDMHHIIADGPSLDLFFNDLLALYNGEEPPPLEFAYKDYCHWFNATITGDELSRQEEYWLETFGGDLPALELPVDFPRPRVQTFAGTNYSFQLDRDMAAGLGRLAASENTTLHTVLLALFFIFLKKMSGNDDIIVGITATGRRMEELRRMIGLFVNTLPIRAGCQQGLTFHQVLRHVDRQVPRAFENQDYPLETLVSKVSVNREASRNPLFDVMFTMQDALLYSNETAGLKIKPYITNSSSSKFDMTLDVLQAEKGLFFSIGYNTDLFISETIVRLGEYLQCLIQEVLQDPGILLEAIDVVPVQEKQKILHQFNAPHPEAGADRFDLWASMESYRTALVFRDEHVTYRELFKWADPAVFGEDMTSPLDHVAAMLAAWKSEDTMSSVAKAAVSYREIYRLSEGTRLMALLRPSDFEFQLWTFASLCAGATVCFIEDVSALARYRRGILVGNWRSMAPFMEQEGSLAPIADSVDVAVSGGVPADRQLTRALAAFSRNTLALLFTMPEVPSVAAILEYQTSESGFGVLVARPAGFETLVVVDESGSLQPIGVTGQLAMAGGRCAGHMLLTGEYGRFLPDGSIELRRIETQPRSLQPESTCAEGKSEEKSMNTIERVLVEVWSDVLGVDEVGVDDDFFAIGGDSLKALAIIVKLEARNYQLDITDLFFNPTIASLYPFVSEAQGIDIPPVEKREYYNASSSQKRLFVLQNRDVRSTVYNIPGSVRLKKNFDRDRLEEAFLKLIQRHESLRTSFPIVNGQLVQRVHQDVEFSLHRLEMDDAGAREFLEEFYKPFHLEEAPLFRVAQLEISGDTPCQELFFDIHHIIADGISCNILINDALELYHGNPLPELELQYRDYTEWQNEELGGELFQEQEQYWLNEFADGAPRLELPLDFPRPGVSKFAGDRFRFEVDEHVAVGLRGLAEVTGSTMYMVLISIFAALLWRLSGQQEIVVGTPVSGRGNDKLNVLVGLFINTVVFRFSPDASMPFGDFLDNVRGNVVEGLKNQDYPFENLVEKLDLNWEFGRNPLFDVMFSYFVNEKNPGEEYLGEDVSLPAYTIKNETAKFDIVLHASDDGRRISLSYEYSTVLFKEETIKGFADDFIEIAGKVAGNSQLKLETFIKTKTFVNSDSELADQLDQDFDF